MANAELVIEIKAELGRIKSQLNQVSSEVRRNSYQIKKSFESWKEGVNNSLKAFKAISVALVGIAGSTYFVKEAIIDVADRYQQLANRIRLYVKNQEELNQVQERLFQIAQESGAALEGVMEVYNRLALAGSSLGLSNEQILNMVETIQLAVRASGTSVQEAQSAILQFSQALASGRLQGDEFRSVMENMPILAKMIADNLGVSVGALKKLGSEGKLTSDVLVKAIIEHKEEVQRMAEGIPLTISQAVQQVRNSWMQLVGQNEQLSQSLIVIKAGFMALAKTMEDIKVGKLKTDFQALSDIFESTFKVFVFGAKWAIKAGLGLKGAIEVIKIAIMKLQEVWLNMVISIIDKIRALFDFINNSQIGDVMVPDAFLRGLKNFQTNLELFRNAVSEARKDTWKDLDKTVGAIESINKAADSFFQNYKNIKNKLQNMGNVFLGNVLGKGGGKGGETGSINKELEKLQNEWEKTKKKLELEIKTTGLDNYQKKLIDLAERFKELKEKFKAIPEAKGIIRKWYEVQVKALVEAHKKSQELLKLQDQIKDIELQALLTEEDRYETVSKLIPVYEQIERSIKNQLQKLQPYSEEWLKLKDNLRDVQEQIYKLREEQRELSDDFFSGFLAGLEELGHEMKSTFKKGKELAQEFAQAIQDAFSTFAMDMFEGKLKSLHDYLMAFLRDIYSALVKYWVQVYIVQNLVNAASGWLAGLFGGGGSTGGATTGMAEKLAFNYFRHEGGLVYHLGGLVRKLHYGGLAPDEVPVILQRGEYVISKKGVEFLDKINQAKLPLGNVNVAVNVVNETGIPVNAEQKGARFDGEKYIVDVVLKNIYHYGPLRHAIAGVK